MFFEILIYFKIYADFVAEYENDNSKIGLEKIFIYKQNPIWCGYYKNADWNDTLQSSYY